MSEIELADLTDSQEAEDLNNDDNAFESVKTQLDSDPSNTSLQEQVQDAKAKVYKSFTDYMQSLFEKAGIRETVTLDTSSADPIGDYIEGSENAQNVMKQITDNVTSNVLKATGASSLADVANSPELQQKLNDKVTENSTEKFKTMRFIAGLLAAAGAVGGIYELLKAIADHETGCYQYHVCAGSETGPIQQIPQASCNCQQTNCASLVALGYCPCQQTDCNAGNLKCDYSQCNYDYYWRNVSVGDVVAQAPQALQDVVKAATGDFMDTISEFFSKFKWILIAIGAFIVVVIIAVIVYKMVSGGNKNSKPEIVEMESNSSE